MITILLARLDKEPVELDGKEPPEFLGLAENDALCCRVPVEYHLLATLVSGGALVRGTCRTWVEGICGRCLEPVRQVVEASDIELFFDLDKAGDELDISEDIREEICLELPMNLLCFADCKGLCPVCGINLNRETCNCEPPSSGSAAWGALNKLKL